MEFISAPGSQVVGYDRWKLPSQQTASVPQNFLSAITIRVTVFVDEQRIPLELEFDADDARSYVG